MVEMKSIFKNGIRALDISGLLGWFNTRNIAMVDIVAKEGIAFSIIEDALSIEPIV